MEETSASLAKVHLLFVVVARIVMDDGIIGVRYPVQVPFEVCTVPQIEKCVGKLSRMEGSPKAKRGLIAVHNLVVTPKNTLFAFQLFLVREKIAC